MVQFKIVIVCFVLGVKEKAGYNNKDCIDNG